MKTTIMIKAVIRRRPKSVMTVHLIIMKESAPVSILIAAVVISAAPTRQETQIFLPIFLICPAIPNILKNSIFISMMLKAANVPNGIACTQIFLSKWTTIALL